LRRGIRRQSGLRKVGLVFGQVAKRAGATRKALRLYEDAGIVAAPRRTSAGYRLYGTETSDVLAFVHVERFRAGTLVESSMGRR
jgi:DNA-binding transcriptional MerR regulator